MMDFNEWITTRGAIQGFKIVFDLHIEPILDTIEQILFIHMHHAYEWPAPLQMILRFVVFFEALTIVKNYELNF